MRRILLLALLIATTALPAAAQTSSPDTTQYAAVRRAVLDYVEGFYEGDSAKLVRAIRPDFFKYGYFRPADSTRYQGMQMTWAQAMAYANRVKAANRPVAPNAPKEIVLLDVLDQTAVAKLTARWGTDYLLLAKGEDGRWQITHVLWQSPPRR